MEQRRRYWKAVPFGLLILAAAVWWLGRGGESRPAPGAASRPLAADAPKVDQTLPVEAADRATAPPTPAAGGGTGRAATRRTPSPELEARRRRVLDALSQRPPSAVTASAAPPAAPREGTMIDRTGQLGEELKVVNRELMPLVDECLEQAHERNPRLRGMLAVQVKLAGAEGVGSVFESVEPAPNNELADDELIECVRQSAFSVEFPVPNRSGRQEAELTIPFHPPDAGARQR